MVKNFEEKDIELICVIVQCGQACKIVHHAKDHGVLGSTVMLGKGTIKNKILQFLDLSDVRKEVIYMLAEKDTANLVIDSIHKKIQFDKPDRGIAFTTTVAAAAGSRCYRCEGENIEDEVEEEDSCMYHLITTIVDKGRAEDVIDAATKAGSNGGTIINGRGSGIHETQKVFAIDIEPEKEVVIILSEKENTRKIVEKIREDLNMDKPGNGIVYIQTVNKAYGM